MRDPWFPIAVILIGLIAVWLGIVGPMPHGVADWIKGWQPLAAAMVASIAAYIAFQNTTRSLEHSAALESHRRTRKHAAIRAVLPVALSQVSDYAERSGKALSKLIDKCVGESLQSACAPEDLARPLEAGTLQTLTDFIEFSDEINVDLVESVLSKIQIHDSRLRDVAAENHNPLSSTTTTRTELEGYIVDAAIIYAATAAIYSYARREEHLLPVKLSWDEVRSALRNMRFWDDEYPRLEENIKRREKLRAHPFDAGRSILDQFVDQI